MMGDVKEEDVEVVCRPSSQFLKPPITFSPLYGCFTDLNGDRSSAAPTLGSTAEKPSEVNGYFAVALTEFDHVYRELNEIATAGMTFRSATGNKVLARESEIPLTSEYVKTIIDTVVDAGANIHIKKFAKLIDIYLFLSRMEGKITQDDLEKTQSQTRGGKKSDP
jgi:hypothetical protein